MIDLRFKELPTGIEVGGQFYRLRTDFRVWIQFMKMVEEDGIASVIVFEDRPPEGDWSEQIMEFAESRNETPKAGAAKGDRTMDLVLDGDYIVGAFQQAYGIDLTDPNLEMHWHRFLALLRSLPESTKLAEIMGYRAYSRSESKKKVSTAMEEAKRRWKLPPVKTPENEAVIEWQEKAFGNIKYP